MCQNRIGEEAEVKNNRKHRNSYGGRKKTEWSMQANIYSICLRRYLSEHSGPFFCRRFRQLLSNFITKCCSTRFDMLPFSVLIFTFIYADFSISTHKHTRTRTNKHHTNGIPQEIRLRGQKLIACFVFTIRVIQFTVQHIGNSAHTHTQTMPIFPIHISYKSSQKICAPKSIRIIFKCHFYRIRQLHLQ